MISKTVMNEAGSNLQVASEAETFTHTHLVSRQFSPPPASPADPIDAKLRRLLDEGRLDEAIVLVRSRGSSAPAMQNAYGVCLMRLGQVESAVRVYRSLVLNGGGLLMRQNVPTKWKTNFATALLLSGRGSGCWSVLDEIADETDPGVQRLREAIQKSRSGQSSWQKFVDWLRGYERPVSLDFLPGDI